MPNEKDIDNLYSKVNKLDARMTEIEATRPFLKEMIERNISSNEKLSETLHEVQATMISMNDKMDAQSIAMDAMKEDFAKANADTNSRISEIDKKVEIIEEKGKFDIWIYLKQNWPWILIVIGLCVNAVAKFVTV